jgi:hypothetical protein
MMETAVDLLLIVGTYFGFAMIFEGFVRILTKDATAPIKTYLEPLPTQTCQTGYNETRPAKKRGRPKGSKNRKTTKTRRKTDRV